MVTVPADSLGAQVAHIGPKPHLVRNISLALCAVLAVVLLWTFYGRAGDPEHPAIAELDQFRGAMFNQCKDPLFGGPTDPTLARRYADDSRLRTTIIEQYHALQRGQASCDQVTASVKRSGYPLR
jgi:hypothetical protein